MRDVSGVKSSIGEEEADGEPQAAGELGRMYILRASRAGAYRGPEGVVSLARRRVPLGSSRRCRGAAGVRGLSTRSEAEFRCDAAVGDRLLRRAPGLTY